MIRLLPPPDPVREVRLYRIGWRIAMNSEVKLSQMVRPSGVFRDRGPLLPRTHFRTPP